MSVEISPSELSFRRPFNDEISQVLRISNPNSTPVAFKVKTTAPKQYCVRPNSGRIEPGHDVEVVVALQAMKTEPPPDAKCRDKFLVQAVSITSDKEFANVASILDSADRSLVVERKIRVAWLPADGEPSIAAVTPGRRSIHNLDNAGDVSGVYDDSHHSIDAGAGAETEDPPSYAHVPSPSTGSSLPAVAEDWKQRAVEAEEKLLALMESETAGLRHRGGQAAHKAAEVVGATAQQARDAPAGVQVQVVAVLCLVSFLLAYFFF